MKANLTDKTLDVLNTVDPQHQTFIVCIIALMVVAFALFVVWKVVADVTGKKK
jgi:hypothetical protein